MVQQVLYDLDLNFGDDLTRSPTGDLAVISGSELSKQRVLRRLLTTPYTYIWQVDYGAGVPTYVGQTLSTDNFARIKTAIRSQIFLETTVSKVPTPQIEFAVSGNILLCQITYTETVLLTKIILNFSIKG